MESIIKSIRSHSAGTPLGSSSGWAALQDAVGLQLASEFEDARYADAQGTAAYIQKATHSLTVRTPQATLHVVAVRTTDAPPLLVLKRVMRRVQTLLRIFRVSKHLTFWFIPTPLRREFPQRASAPICAKHINGGFTYPTLNTVYIYRTEEFAKVMLHETIHHTPLDTSGLWNAPDARGHELGLYKLLGIDEVGCPHHCKTSLNPNEAIVEAWAEIFQIAFVAHEHGVPWRRLYNMEMQWALQQSSRILQKQLAMGGRWEEESHAYSYIVLRAILLQDIPRLASGFHSIAEYCSAWEKGVVSLRKLRGTKPSAQSRCLRMSVLGDL